MPTKVFKRNKQSPSTLKRNARRKKAFMEKKAVEKLTEQQTVKSSAEHTEITFKCNQCDVAFISKDTLDKHITEKHSGLEAELAFKIANKCLANDSGQ